MESLSSILNSCNVGLYCTKYWYIAFALFCFQKSGICDIIPGAQIDDFLFDPCGYSMNGLLPGVGTIRIPIYTFLHPLPNVIDFP